MVGVRSRFRLGDYLDLAARRSARRYAGWTGWVAARERGGGHPLRGEYGTERLSARGASYSSQCSADLVSEQ